MLVTADAIHRQAETARLVAERGETWLFALKANRPAMLAEVEPAMPTPRHRSRRTRRSMPTMAGSRPGAMWSATTWRGCSPTDATPDEPHMPGLVTLAMVEANVERNGRTTSVRRYYFSSAALSAKRFAVAVRAHLVHRE